MKDIAHNLQTVQHRIIEARQVAGGQHESIKLIAVSKGKSQEDVLSAIAAGQRVFGENRVQEASTKFGSREDLRESLELHLIGPLQTNKAEEAVKLFDVIETLDRPKLADALAAAVKKTGRTPLCYIEVNSGLELQKAGIAPDALAEFLDYSRNCCRLQVVGLMCIPPQDEDPAPHFLRLKDMAIDHGLSRLSMGMSADFETAIHCGATEVRVGSAIFGAR